MKRAIIAILLWSLVIVTAACSASVSDTGQDSPPGSLSSAPGAPARSSGGGGTGQTAAVPDTERMVVHNGTMALVVKDVVAARTNVASLATNYGGYVVSTKITGEGEDVTGDISIRVPDQKFDQALSELRAMALSVSSENVTSKDVTQDYVDLQSRLKNAQATHSQYLTLMQRATTTEDIIKIQDKLSQTQGDIEVLKGEIQYIEQTVSMSLISVRLGLSDSSKGLAIAGWDALDLLRSAAHGFIVTLQVLAAIAIWLVVFTPLWAIIAGIVYWNRRRKRKAVVAAPKA